MPKVFGSVDELERPVVRIQPVGKDEILAVIDTGFNRQLMMRRADAMHCGVSETESFEKVELGTGDKLRLRKGIGNFHWLGAEHVMEVFLSDELGAPHRADQPVALIGTRLLRSCLLLIDFDVGLVEIEKT